MLRCIVYIFLPIVFLACQSGKAGEKKPARVVGAGLHQPIDVFTPVSEEDKSRWADEIDAFYQQSYVRNGFSGAFLVAKEGEIIYEAYNGFVNPNTQEKITDRTPFHLASVGKTFTGTTVMRLVEQGRLSLNDSVRKWFPDLPYQGITLQMLLSHRSGLPNYLYFMEKGWDKNRKASNEDVVNFMVQNKPNLQSWPGRSFHYCNTNYLMLALIIEKTVGMKFPQYMKDSVFTPLGMDDSFVFNAADSARYVPTYNWNNAVFYMDHTDFTYGDKNIYSTVRDLLKWDRAMYEHSFVNAATTKQAFTGQSYEKKSYHNYGLGWRIIEKGQDTVVYHNGKWHGSNTVFYRMPQQRATIIMLGNKSNINIYKVKRIGKIFTGRTDEEEAAE